MLEIWFAFINWHLALGGSWSFNEAVIVRSRKDEDAAVHARKRTRRFNEAVIVRSRKVICSAGYERCLPGFNEAVIVRSRKAGNRSDTSTSEGRLQ